MFETFPYTNYHNLNLDWILRKLVEHDETIAHFVAQNTIKYADPIQWDITNQYPRNTVVLDRNLIAYLSTQPVPTGIPLSNTDYWTEIGSFGTFFNSLIDSIAYNNGNSDVLTADIDAENLVYADNVLYMATADLMNGDALRAGTNCEVYTVNDFIHYLVTKEAEARTAAIQHEASVRSEADEALEAADMEIIGRVNNLKTYVDDRDTEIIEMISQMNNSVVINVKDYGAVGDGNTDDINAFNSALTVARQNGGIIYIPSGIYLLSRPFVIGNGNAQKESDYHDITIIGEGEGNSRYISSHPQGRTVLKRTGNTAGSMITVSGPITGVKIMNLQLDCNGIAEYGIYNQHGAYCTFTHISVIKYRHIAYYSTTVAGTPAVYGAAGNKWSMIQCDDGYNGTQTCMILTGSLSDANSYNLDTCRNVVERFEFNYGIGGRAIVLEFADNNIFIEGQTYCDPETPNGTSLVFNRPTAHPNFPSENLFINAALIKGVSGNPGQVNEYGAGGHWFIPYPHADGEPLPTQRGTHALLYDGKELFDGKQVMKQTNYRADQIGTVPLTAGQWTTLATHTVEMGQTPGSYECLMNLAVSNSTGVRILFDGSEVRGSYKHNTQTGSSRPITSLVIAYFGTGTHTIEYQAYGGGSESSVNGGYVQSRIIL